MFLLEFYQSKIGKNKIQFLKIYSKLTQKIRIISEFLVCSYSGKSPIEMKPTLLQNLNTVSFSFSAPR